MLSNIERIYSNMEAFNLYDELLSNMIRIQYIIKDNEKVENYEICAKLHTKIMNEIAFRSIQINRITGINSDELFEMFQQDYKDLKIEVEKTF